MSLVLHSLFFASPGEIIGHYLCPVVTVDLIEINHACEVCFLICSCDWQWRKYFISAFDGVVHLYWTTQKRYLRAFSFQLFLSVKKDYQSFTKSLFFMNAQISPLLFPFQLKIKPKNFLGDHSWELKWWGRRYCFESCLPRSQIDMLWNHCSCLLLFC